MNHQNRDDYFLLFKNGQAYVSLHTGFERRLKGLVELLRLEKKLEWYFKSSCYCSTEAQKKTLAQYCNQRSLYFLHKGNARLALKYARECVGHSEFEDNHALALVAVVSSIPRLQSQPSNAEDAVILYWYGYMQKKFGNLIDHGARWDRIIETLNRQEFGAGEWSWSSIVRSASHTSLHEANEVWTPAPTVVIELPAGDPS